MGKVTKLRSGYAAGLLVCFNAIGDELVESVSVASVKDASLANPLTSDARSVMLRIPLPEDDGFALTLPEVARATPTDNFALLALKGRQSTDGGERSVTPGQPPPSPYPLPCAVGAGRGCY